MASGNGNNIQDYGYITHLTLADGSFMSGETFRIGYEGSDNTAYIIATGSAPVRISQPIVVLRGHSNPANVAYTNFWEWAVADVTGDAAPDFFLDGELQNYQTASFCMRPILKTGAGTVRLGAANSYTGSVAIAEGTVLLGADGVWWCFPATQLLTFLITAAFAVRSRDLYGYGKSGIATALEN